MKKLFLSVAALLCATLMFAQNNDTKVKQQGIDNDSYVLQIGKENKARVNQKGNRDDISDVNTSRIVTNGQYNFAKTYSLGTDNMLFVMQSEEVNDVLDFKASGTNDIDSRFSFHRMNLN